MLASGYGTSNNSNYFGEKRKIVVRSNNLSLSKQNMSSTTESKEKEIKEEESKEKEIKEEEIKEKEIKEEKSKEEGESQETDIDDVVRDNSSLESMLSDKKSIASFKAFISCSFRSDYVENTELKEQGDNAKSNALDTDNPLNDKSWGNKVKKGKSKFFAK